MTATNIALLLLFLSSVGINIYTLKQQYNSEMKNMELGYKLRKKYYEEIISLFQRRK